MVLRIYSDVSIDATDGMCVLNSRNFAGWFIARAGRVPRRVHLTGRFDFRLHGRLGIVQRRNRRGNNRTMTVTSGILKTK
jgi:hypothetical protein